MRVVVDDEHPPAGEDLPGVRIGGVVDLAGRRVEQDTEGEDRAAVGVVAVADGAAHGLHDLPTDGQPEAGAPVDAGGRGVGLGERLEQARDLVRGDADPGVADRHAQVGAVVRTGLGGGAHDDLALLGELDGVGDQVGQHLRETRGVAREHLGHLGSAGDHQLQPPRARRGAEHAGDLLDDLADLEVQDLQLQAPGLDLGEVQDVVEHPEQRPAGHLHPGREALLVGVEGSAHQQVVEADDAVERGADLVAHRGQEVRLHPRGLHGRVARLLQLRGRVFPPGHQGHLGGDVVDHLLDHGVPEQGRSRGDGDDREHLATQLHGEPDRQARVVPGRLAVGEHLPRQAQLRRVAQGIGRVAGHHDRHEVPVLDPEAAGPLPVVVEQHQVPCAQQELVEARGRVGSARDRLHQGVLGDLVLQGEARLLHLVDVLQGPGHQQSTVAVHVHDAATTGPHPLLPGLHAHDDVEGALIGDGSLDP